MTRAVAILAVALGVATFFFYLHQLGKGPFASLEARHLREMKDRAALPESYELMTHEQFLALPRGLEVAEYSGLERRAVTVEGYVSELLRAIDGDYHAELGPWPDSLRVRGVPPITTEVTPQWHGDAADGWGFERLTRFLRPDVAGPAPWDGGPARVRLSGWLMYDRETHFVQDLLGWKPPRRATDWEIHPVTKIERWDEARLAWVEVRR